MAALTSSTAKKKTLIALVALLSSCMFVVLYVGVLSTNFGHIRLRLHFQNLLASSRRDISHKYCVFYDKSPRTGSSTIVNSLSNCWKYLHYKYKRRVVALLKQYPGTTFISHALNISNTDRVMIAGEHFTIQNKDVLLFASVCENIFYVTSTRPMKERIMSKIKYQVSGAHTYLNTSVSEHSRRKALTKISNPRYISKAESRLEKYPFYNIDLTIPPDYVIRSASLHQDLRDLLDAFSCTHIRIKSKNIHFYNVSSSTKQTSPTSHESETQGNVTEDAKNIDVGVPDDAGDADGDADADADTDTDGDDGDDDDANDGSDDEEEIRLIEQDDLSQINLTFGDARHRRMLKLAERINQRGLQKARLFL